MIIHSPESEIERYSHMLRKKTKESSSPLLRSSFRHSSIENTMIYYFVDRFEVTCCFSH